MKDGKFVRSGLAIMYRGGLLMAYILVVDDEASIRELLCTVLSRKGHDVLLADGGQKGIDLYRKRHPQLTILDLHMPDISGGSDPRRHQCLEQRIFSA